MGGRNVPIGGIFRWNTDGSMFARGVDGRWNASEMQSRLGVSFGPAPHVLIFS